MIRHCKDCDEEFIPVNQELPPDNELVKILCIDNRKRLRFFAKYINGIWYVTKNFEHLRLIEPYPYQNKIKGWHG